MSKENKSRREFLKLAGISAGSISLASSLARAETPDHSTGPFFPNPGTTSVQTTQVPATVRAVSMPDGVEPIEPVRTIQPSPPSFFDQDNDLTQIRNRGTQAQGALFNLKGSVKGANTGEMLEEALVTIWQANHHGRYDHSADINNLDFIDPRSLQAGSVKSIQRDLDHEFQYFGKDTTTRMDPINRQGAGNFEFKTIIPGFYPASVSEDLSVTGSWYRPPHIHIQVEAQGKKFVTQMYFRGRDLKDNDFIQELNERDSLLNLTLLSNAFSKLIQANSEIDLTRKLQALLDNSLTQAKISPELHRQISSEMRRSPGSLSRHIWNRLRIAIDPNDVKDPRNLLIVDCAKNESGVLEGELHLEIPGL